MGILIALINTFSFYRLHSHTMQFRFRPKYLFPAYALFYMQLFMQKHIHDWVTQAPLKFVFMVLPLIYPFFLYKDRIAKRLCFIFVAYFLYALSDMVVLFLVTHLLHLTLTTTLTTPHYLYSIMFTAAVLFWIATEIIIQYILRTKGSVDAFRKEVNLLLGTDLLYILIFMGLFYRNNAYLSMGLILPFAFCCFIVVSIISLCLLYKVAQKSREVTETKLQMHHIALENLLNDNLADVTDNLRSLRHDMNNHFGVLQGLLSLGEYDEASLYLSSILKDLEVANSFVFTGNKKLSVLINSKISKAITHKVPIDTTILVKEFPMEDPDLCAVVGNILENALEAATSAPEPDIVFSIEKKGGDCIICCSNTFSVKPILKNGRLITTKEDKELHGIGSRIIQSVAKKYKGTVDFIVDERFRVVFRVPY